MIWSLDIHYFSESNLPSIGIESRDLPTPNVLRDPDAVRRFQRSRSRRKDNIETLKQVWRECIPAKEDKQAANNQSRRPFGKQDRIGEWSTCMYISLYLNDKKW